jgi:diguanylate cyclase (GGDEF)-like protein
MLLASTFPPATLDVPTLSFVAVCIAAMLGLFLIFTWLQQRSIRALAWWGAAYLVGAASMALWSAPMSSLAVPPELPSALIFIACGMIWNGVRLFQGRRLLPFAAFAGAMVWLVVCRFPAFAEGSNARIVLGGAVVATYTFWIAFELGRERRKSLYSPAAAVLVPGLHAGVFLLPLGMRTFLPDVVAASWLTVFVLETIIYGVGTAFMVLMMVQDRQVLYYRNAATTDFLTKLPNRRAFREGACMLCDHQARRNGPVTLLMFDLDHFKHINDRFGHATGDEALRVFAQAVRSSMRAGDLVARIGGEEFAAIVPASRETAANIAERVRATFETAGEMIDGKPLGATVSIGAATSCGPATIDALFSHADAALYTAKELGRNRAHIVNVEPLSARDVAIAAPNLPQPLMANEEKPSEAPLPA